MKEYYFVFDYAIVSILDDANLIIDDVIEKKSKEYENLSDKQIIKKLKELKEEFEALPDPTQYKDCSDIETFRRIAEKRATIYLQRQLLTNSYALNKGASKDEIYYISNIEYNIFLDNTANDIVTNIDSIVEYNQEYSFGIIVYWQKLIKNGQIPIYGVSNALRYEYTEGIVSLPWRGTISDELKKELRQTMQDQVKRNGNKAEDVYRTILAAYSVDCFNDEPTFNQAQAEFENIKLNRGKFSKEVSFVIKGRKYKPSTIDKNGKKINSKEGKQGLKDYFAYCGNNMSERLKRIKEETYLSFALELLGVLGKK